MQLASRPPSLQVRVTDMQYRSTMRLVSRQLQRDVYAVSPAGGIEDHMCSQNSSNLD